jgi:hypothetical protein
MSGIRAGGILIRVASRHFFLFNYRFDIIYIISHLVILILLLVLIEYLYNIIHNFMLITPTTLLESSYPSASLRMN